MAAKKSSSKAHKKIEAVSPSLEEPVIKEERKPPVTQVVEVVEDEAPAVPLESSGGAVSQVPLEEATPTEENTGAQDVPVVPPASQNLPEDEVADEKRKELVDELFQKKPMKAPEVTPEISMHTKRTTNPIMLWAIGVVVACLVAGGTLLVLSGKAGSLPSIVVIPTPTSTPTPKMTPTPTPNETTRESLSIQVLNGGGVAGAATKMKKALEDKGYLVTDTGNAGSYTYEKTEIIVKASKKAYIPLLEEDLKDSYTLGSSAASLEDTASYDARVIVGKE